MRSAALIAALALPMLPPAASLAQEGRAPDRWQVQATGPVRLTMEAGEPITSAWARSGDGTWHRLDPAPRDGAVELSLGPDQLQGGSALVVINPPEWLHMDDAEPPAVVRFSIDGASHPDADRVALGWIESLPGIMILGVRDEHNPIDRDSIRVAVLGRTLRPGDAGVTFSPHGQTEGTLRVDLREIDGLADEMRAEMQLIIDDFAIDEADTRRSISWALAPSMTLDDGTVLTVDSLTAADGWRDWSVIADGVVMTEQDPTTAGNTWLSDNRRDEHWIRWDFPEPRTVVGVELGWPYYQVWRTSRSYDVQTWSDNRWVTRVEVRDQPEQGGSEHRFDPVETTSVRVLQHPLGGQAQRQDLMWLAEAAVVCAE